ncbi:T9SS type A sorting domain-containing protein [Phaeocystidibacter marisrubri]|uniref:T9SS type A sorting domain-containing protein n=1 Tax=Phaeocystidibacter marisrubri TaxID=1577780 RepID=A0A6L3ZFC7_9FLAO|nr:T9SS type A sorting domain-containing protein [Phaeocystidibacter marisrubri]KAB2816565.1 T9SS type A sorting domain-containing protein [Phaeocystidibacter marisrubri]GGH69697.1 hypothetical protein GCM10011318_10980 [Phaeocystidibacter marisrubri]
MRIIKQLVGGFSLVALSLTGYAQSWSQIDKIVASDRQPGDYFSSDLQTSYGVSIFGDYAIVGSPRDDHSGLTNAGSAYIYEKDANCNWVETQKLISPDANDNDYFGFAVAMYGDFLVVSARNDDEDENGLNYMSGAGSAYVFQNTGGSWVFVQKIVASDRETGAAYGHDVDITARRIIIGAWGEDGGSGVPSATNAGAAYIYRWDGVTWNEIQKIVASDRASQDQFGTAVAISGEFAVVGSPRESEDVNGLNTMSSSGSAYFFEFIGGVWTEVQKVTSSDRGSSEYYGMSVDLDKDRAIIGARNDNQDENGVGSLTAAGSAFIYHRAPGGSGTWNQINKIDASDRATGDRFGFSVGISGNTAVVGAPLEDQDATGGNTVSGAGSSYIFEFNGSSWAQSQKIVHGDRSTYDWFGVANAIYGNGIIVSANEEDEDDSAVPTNTMAESGSAYMFDISPSPATQPTVSASSLTFCPGNSVTLSISSGTLNDAANWQWYTGSCNGTVVGTGTSITVTPGATTTYYVNGVGGCVNPGPCGSITVSATGTSWHQTSHTTYGDDVNNDVVTDAAGNVYVVGTFIDKTTLSGGNNPDISLSTGVGPQSASFVAKYDLCGSLIWAAHTTNSKDNFGNAIELDENAGIVYIAGDYLSNLTFVSACGTSSTIYSTGNSKGYVAAFEMSNGCPIFLEEVVEDVVTSLEAIAINETNGDIYVGGFAAPSSSAPHTSYVHKYSPSGGLGGLVLNISSNNMGAYRNEVKDLDFDEVNNWLWVIGDFEDEVEFFPGMGVMSVQIPGTTTQDAFLLAYEDNGGTWSTIINRRGNASLYMSGEGIAVNPYTGSPAMAGTYQDGVNTPFQLGGVNNLPSFSGNNGYLVYFDLGLGSGWSKYANVSGSHAYGTAVHADGNYIYFSGNFNRNNVNIQSIGNFPYTVSGVPLNYNHVFLACYEDNGFGVWGNVTEDPTTNTFKHESKAIAAWGSGKVYTVGNYYGKMDYFNTSGSPVLVSSGSGDNAFILRAEQSNGDLYKTLNEENVASNELTVFPNPTSDIVRVEMTDFDPETPYVLSVSNIAGQVLERVTMTSADAVIDLSSYNAGVYMLKAENGEEVRVVKVIKTE